MKRWLLILLPLLLAAGYGFSPYYSALQLIDAAHHDKVDKLERYIDFPTLQANIKARLQSELAASMGSVPPELAGLVRAGSDLILGPVVERLVSPEGIRDVIQGRRDWRELERQLKGRTDTPRNSNPVSPGSASEPTAPVVEASASTHQHRWHLASWRFTGLNRVVADCRERDAGEGGDTVRLFFTRQGLRWRLVDIALLSPAQTTPLRLNESLPDKSLPEANQQEG